MRKAKAMTDKEIARELVELGKRWNSFRAGVEDEGMSGSPGEWMIERMGELETEQKRRTAGARLRFPRVAMRGRGPKKDQKSLQFNLRLSASDAKRIEEIGVAMAVKAGKLLTRSDVVRALIRQANT